MVMEISLGDGFYGFYIFANQGIDKLMTHVYIPPSNIKLWGISPNVHLQLLPEAGATEERRLEAVSYKPLFGGTSSHLALVSVRPKAVAA